MMKRQFTIKELRARKNKTQKEASEDIGISTPTYCAWENDVSRVPFGMVWKMAEYYGVTVDEIFLPTT